MTLDVCLEVSGSYAHLIGVDTVNSVLAVRRRVRRRSVPAGPTIDRFEDRLSAAIDRLPFLLAHVLWLVDVCGCTYETAAAELGLSPDRVEQLMAEARHRVRHDLTDPGRSPAGSTSRSRPGLPQPDR